MSWSIVLVLGVCVFTAHSAVYRTKDATLSRIARSPHYGSSYHHDDFDLPPPPHGPPPPPIVYHTQNWSGVSKGLGGAPQGVFSGAAASAQSAAPAGSEAFSIAASGTGPANSDDRGQVKDNSGFGSQSNSGGSGRHYSAESFGNKYGGGSNGYDNSDESQHNIKSSGLQFGGGASGRGSHDSGSQSGQYNTGSGGFERKSAGGVSAGYGSSLGEYHSADYDRQSGQRNINSGFGGQSFGSGTAEYGRANGQHGSFKGFGGNGGGSEGHFGSGSLTSGNSAGRSAAGFGNQSGQFNLQTSNKARFNGQNGPYDAASTGFGGQSTDTVSAGSASQFGNYNGQTSESGFQADCEDDHFDHHGDTHRHGKSHHEHFGQSGNGKNGYQGSAGQSFGENGQVRASGFPNSRSTSFERNRGNYGSGSSGSEANYSGNQGQVDQLRKLDSGLSASQTGSQDFSDSQQEKKFGQLDSGSSSSQLGSPAFSGTQSQSSSGASGFGYNKKSGSPNLGNKGTLEAGNANGGISQAEGSLSAGVGASGQEDVQSTLGSALNLASQGLQTAQRVPCSNCDRSSYALSNANSSSGSAIALSIGG